VIWHLATAGNAHRASFFEAGRFMRWAIPTEYPHREVSYFIRTIWRLS